MRSPDMFIVKPVGGRRYDNIKTIGEKELITSTSQEDHRVSNRYGEVIERPIGYSGPIKVGDQLIVHHNVFKYYYDVKGRQKSGRSYFKDDLFFVDELQMYMYGSDGNWKAIEPYCFVEPLVVPDPIFGDPMHEPQFGVLRYGNKSLSKMGVNAGATVAYTPESEYEFPIDGSILYRMRTSDITLYE